MIEESPDKAVVAPALRNVVRVWDFPVRVIHWSLVLALPAMWWTAEYNAMDWHIRIGFAVLVLVVFRLLWGLFGSSTARFATFVVEPRRVLRYLRGREPHLEIGHNPAGAYSVLLLLGLLAVQIGLGLIAGDPDDGAAGPLNSAVRSSTATAATQLHEILFYALVVAVVMHLAAVAFYLVVRRDDLITPMITGRRAAESRDADIASPPAWKLALCASTAVAIGWWIWKGAFLS